MRILFAFFLLTITINACQNASQESSVSFKDTVKTADDAKEPEKLKITTDSQQKDATIGTTKSNCDSIWNNWQLRYSQKDSILHSIVDQFELSLPKGNLNLLIELLQRKDSLLKFKQPLSAIFKGLAPEPFMISNIQERKVEDRYKQYYPEDYFFEKVDTSKTDMYDFNSRKYFKQIMDELPKGDRRIKILGLENTTDALVSVVGKQESECEPYAFYNFDYLGSDSLSTPLIASPYKIELEYGNWPEIDSIIKQNNSHHCTDCPNSLEKGKTFARLKGTTNTYFSYQGPDLEDEESYTPGRSLFYVSKEFEIIDLWSDSIDLFGCSCL